MVCASLYVGIPTIVLDESGVDITRYAAVMHLIIILANEYVNIMEAFHRTSRGIAEGSSAKKAGLPSRSL